MYFLFFKQDLYRNLYFSKIPRLFLQSSKISIIIFLKVYRINYTVNNKILFIIKVYLL